jgi:transcriptional regulator with XRE-family HTH domain
MTEGNATAHIGRRIREIRTWRKLSIKELAELAGFSESYLSRIERGDRPVLLSVIPHADAPSLLMRTICG